MTRNSTSLGSIAKQAVADKLLSDGFKIIDRSWRNGVKLWVQLNKHLGPIELLGASVSGEHPFTIQIVEVET